MEDKKTDEKGKFLELYDIRKELMNIEYSLSLVKKNCNTLNISLKKSEVVEKELNNLPDDTKIFDSCGRMFVLSNKKEALNNLLENKQIMIKEIKVQNEKKEYLEKNLAEKSKAYAEVAKQNKAK